MLWYVPGFESQFLRPCSISTLALGKALACCDEFSYVGIASPQLNVAAQLSDKLELIPISKNPFFIFRQLRRTIEEKDVNLVQERLGCHYLFSDWGILAGNHMGLPTIGILHEYPPTFTSKLLAKVRLRHSLKICNKLFVINKVILQYIPLQKNELTKVGLIPNGYDGSILASLDVDSSVDMFPMNKKLVGYFGDLSENKGVNIMLDLIRHADDNFFFLIAGRGLLEKEVKRLSEIFPEKCGYVGHLKQKEVYSIMSLCDVTLALLPQDLKKGYPQYVNPLKVYESLAVGTPVVISEPTLSMLPQDIADLCVVASGIELEGLFNKLDVACRRKADEASMSAVMRKYSWNYIAKNILIPIYEKLMTNSM
jgi:glycosyltransferase involved in cell wall biosynthesis